MPLRLRWASLREKVRAAKAASRALPASTGGANCVFAPNNFTNAVTTIGTPHFFSQYLPIDFILNNQFKTPWARLPFNVLGEFIVNPASQVASAGLYRAPFAPTWAARTRPTMIDVSIGQQKNKNDISGGLRLEPH